MQQKPSKKPYVKLGLIKLDIKNACIHPNTYKYIRYDIVNKLKNPNDIIHQVKSIGHGDTDKILCLTNLFFICVKSDKIDMMQRIIDYYKDEKNVQNFIVNAYDRDYTPLMHATYNGCIESVKFLLSYGANIDIINKDGEDIFSATTAGLNKALTAEKVLKLLVTNKYKEIYEYLKWWKSNNMNIEEQLSSIKIENINDIKEAKKSNEVNLQLNTNDGIEALCNKIKELIEKYIENTNTSLMTKLFIEISNLIDNNYLTIDKTKQIIKPYITFLEEFEDIPNIFLEEIKSSIKINSPINIDENIYIQIDKLLNDYTKLNNVKMLKNLFIDINMLLKLNYISKELIKETLETYDDILLSDYFNEMKILNF